MIQRLKTARHVSVLKLPSDYCAQRFNKLKRTPRFIVGKLMQQSLFLDGR